MKLIKLFILFLLANLSIPPILCTKKYPTSPGSLASPTPSCCTSSGSEGEEEEEEEDNDTNSHSSLLVLVSPIEEESSVQKFLRDVVGEQPNIPKEMGSFFLAKLSLIHSLKIQEQCDLLCETLKRACSITLEQQSAAAHSDQHQDNLSILLLYVQTLILIIDLQAHINPSNENLTQQVSDLCSYLRYDDQTQMVIGIDIDAFAEFIAQLRSKPQTLHELHEIADLFDRIIAICRPS